MKQQFDATIVLRNVVTEMGFVFAFATQRTSLLKISLRHFFVSPFSIKCGDWRQPRKSIIWFISSLLPLLIPAIHSSRPQSFVVSVMVPISKAYWGFWAQRDFASATSRMRFFLWKPKFSLQFENLSHKMVGHYSSLGTWSKHSWGSFFRSIRKEFTGALSLFYFIWCLGFCSNLSLHASSRTGEEGRLSILWAGAVKISRGVNLPPPPSREIPGTSLLRLSIGERVVVSLPFFYRMTFTGVERWSGRTM